MKKYLWTEDKFFPEAAALRAVFDRRFADPRAARSDRFVWDFWHIPDQYTLLRTPAAHFFPRAPFASFLRRLGQWGRSTLGCSALTPPWLSCYVEGCEQKLHADVPHGPWAYVFSLAPLSPRYTGGETILLRPEVLSYWRNFSSRGHEYENFVRKVPARFNRLTVFDPRLPHGVAPVRGTLDPREGRLVIHGWFVDPKPYLQGALSARQAAPVLDEAVGALSEELAGFGSTHGILSLRISVNASGSAKPARVLADTLVAVEGDAAQAARALVRKHFAKLRFPKKSRGTEITLPLLFR